MKFATKRIIIKACQLSLIRHRRTCVHWRVAVTKSSEERLLRKRPVFTEDIHTSLRHFGAGDVVNGHGDSSCSRWPTAISRLGCAVHIGLPQPIHFFFPYNFYRVVCLVEFHKYNNSPSVQFIIAVPRNVTVVSANSGELPSLYYLLSIHYNTSL